MGVAAGARATRGPIISDVHVGSCRDGGDSESKGNEGDDEHQQALLEDGDDQGDCEGGSGHGQDTRKNENSGDKQESKVKAGQLCVACACAYALVLRFCCAKVHTGGSCWSPLW